MRLIKKSKHTFIFHMALMSCGILFAQNNTRKTEDSIKFDKHYNVEIKINDKPKLLKFDTGAAISTLDTISISSVDKSLYQLIREEEFLDPLGNIKKFPVYMGLNFEIDKFLIKSPEFVGFSNKTMMKLSCELADNSVGVLGMNVFMKDIASEKRKVILIDNESSEILIFNELKLDKNSDYNEIDSNFKNNQIKIDLEVEGNKVEAILDTGYNGFLTINKKFRKLKKFDAVNFEKSLVFTLFGQSDTSEEYIQGPKIELGDFELENNLITVNESFSQPVLGTQMINRFSWIIDFEREKVYVKLLKKKIKIDILNQLRTMVNIAIAINGKLIILKTKNDNLKVGQVIKKIDGTEVSDANICDFERLLFEKTSEWKSFKFEVK
jgi:predicted aspartyl protease